MREMIKFVDTLGDALEFFRRHDEALERGEITVESPADADMDEEMPLDVSPWDGKAVPEPIDIDTFEEGARKKKKTTKKTAASGGKKKKPAEKKPSAVRKEKSKRRRREKAKKKRSKKKKKKSGKKK